MIQDGRNSEGAPLRDGLPVQAPSPSGLGHSAGIPGAAQLARAKEVASGLEGAARVCWNWAKENHFDGTRGRTEWLSLSQRLSEYSTLLRADIERSEAKAIEAGTGETERLGAKHESAVHAPKHNQEPTNG